MKVKLTCDLFLIEADPVNQVKNVVTLLCTNFEFDATTGK